MTLQIQGIAIYSTNGERREIRFDLNRLNIVTGAAKTGKSALLGIVDYCWGRDECVVPGGEIRRAVSWFAVLFDRDGEGVLVARRNVAAGAKGSDQIYLERNVDDFPANPDRFRKNETVDGVRASLSALLGITENVHVPESGSARVPLEASASQAILFCLQEQDEIANKRLLFHRQGEERIPQAIKDALPYFVGAIGEDHYLKQKRRQDARARLRRLERQLVEAKALVSDASANARALAEEARRVGLIGTGPLPEGEEELRAMLAAAAAPREMGYSAVDAPGADLAELEEARRRLRGELQELRDEQKELRRISLEMSDFETETREQQARLASIGLVVDTDGAHGTCPVCDSQLEIPVPTVEELRRSLEGVDLQLATVRRDNPRLQKRISEIEARRTTLENDLTAVQRDIVGRIAQNERLRVEQDQLTEQARISGRIGYYLENVQEVILDKSLALNIARVRAELSELEEALDQEALEERLITALNLIGRDLTDFAIRLQLEHGEGGVRLDRRNLTIVADTMTGPLPLSQIGSGENWVGYHVATHLAVHRLFRARNRPVPAFVMFDQPSQAHYPRERDVGEITGTEDEDQIAVARLYRLLWDYCDNIAPGMQVIVTDHVDLLQDWFREAATERWRDGIKLVPMSWLN